MVDRITSILLRIMTYAIFITSTVVLLFPLVKGLGYFSVDFFTRFPSQGMTQGGVLPAIVGSIYLIALVCIISVPAGILIGIFLSEYAKPLWLASLLRVAITMMTSIPSIVYGLFGLAFFCITMKLGTSLIAASFTLSIMTIPFVGGSVSNFLMAVSKDLREAAIAMGADKRETVFMVIRAARTGILSSSLLGLGRAFGETAPILVTGAVFYATNLPKRLTDPVMTLPTHVYAVITNFPEDAYWMAYASAALMIIIIIAIYSVVQWIRRRSS